MKCPKCGFDEDRVVDSRTASEGATVRRRRECAECGHRFTTIEEVVPAEVYVRKRDERREELNPQKLRDGIHKACWKRPVSEEQVDAIVASVIRQLESLGEREVPADQIGELLMKELEQLDDIAYIRFASVYRQFKGADEFISEVRELNRKQKGRST
jgi:transcriptional repressor NrdR